MTFRNVLGGETSGNFEKVVSAWGDFRVRIKGNFGEVVRTSEKMGKVKLQKSSKNFGELEVDFEHLR